MAKSEDSCLKELFNFLMNMVSGHIWEYQPKRVGMVVIGAKFTCNLLCFHTCAPKVSAEDMGGRFEKAQEAYENSSALNGVIMQIKQILLFQNYPIGISLTYYVINPLPHETLRFLTIIKM